MSEKMTINEHLMQQNALLSRAAFVNRLIDQKRDIDAECGYPKDITVEDYKLLYDREGIATRVVSIFPEECWSLSPFITETEEGTETDFEKEFSDLADKFNFWHYLQRVDELSGVGHYGILLIGVDDGKELHEPVEGVMDDGSGAGNADRKLLYLRPFPENYVQIASYESDPQSPRFGKPKFYNIQFQDHSTSIQHEAKPESTSRKVHWHRVIHVADNRKSSEVLGVPRMRPVFNRLYDLRKILSGSGEMFWKGAFPGYSFEVDPQMLAAGAEIDKKEFRKEFEEYSNGLQRYIALTGVSAKSLAPQVSDPGPHVMTHLKALCISLGVPWRVFMGSEEAKLASQQDTKTWNSRLAYRQSKYLEPMIIREFIQRLIALGIITSEPKDGYKVDFPDLNSVTDGERADVAVKQTEALSKYIGGSVDTLIPPKEYFMHIMNMSLEEAEGLIAAAQKYLSSIDPDSEEGSEDDPNEEQEEEDTEEDEYV